jgi:hypothetical protein
MPTLETPIDFDHGARMQLVADHRAQIETLLAGGFDLLENEGISLQRFGFPSTLDAVDWAINRFATGQFDPSKLKTRTWRLFSQGRFWLAQKIGMLAYKRIVAELKSAPLRTETAPSASHSETAVSTEEHEELIRVTGKTLGQLNALVRAPGLIADWLSGTERLRRWWLFPAPESPEQIIPARHKKDRSFRMHDAMFRFQCVAHDLLGPDQDEERQIVLAWLFSPAGNVPPFRVEDLTRFGNTPTVQGLRREGIMLMLMTIAAELRDPAHSLWLLFRQAHGAFGIKSTTLNVFSLDNKGDTEPGDAISAIASHSVHPPWEKS